MTPPQVPKAKLPPYFFLGQPIGLAALTLGALTLFTQKRDAIVGAIPILANRSLDWCLLALGVLVLASMSLLILKTTQRHQDLNRKMHERRVEEARQRQLYEPRPLQSPMTLKPLENVWIGVILGWVVGLGMIALGVAGFMQHSSLSSFAICMLFSLFGTLIVLTATNKLFCRVELRGEEIFYTSMFCKRSFRAQDIRSAIYSRTGNVKTLKVSTAQSWFIVTTSNFTQGQLEIIRKFCDPSAT
ncbi:hypothetical protein [Rhodanobacter denitrificans]|uniref:Uncharacterized protein n=1 Tax=Rhodanobacter denitrificans TaxID=666685 RepID=M4NFS4_9GAMM|nr:hypothetical protein [Rhodanobacter denitrificans]AGG89734.1 hypothetical protein R2APBS1_2654 [Rhodanobacter denitrificans]UJM85134.1 hypothetical protein LRJ86_10110 [Rhodanobacter denitrificans]